MAIHEVDNFNKSSGNLLPVVVLFLHQMPGHIYMLQHLDEHKLNGQAFLGLM